MTDNKATTVKAYDIDGTLLESGFVTDKTLDYFREDLENDDVITGILSARPMFMIDIAVTQLDVDPAFKISAGMNGKTEELKQLKNEIYPDYERYVYVGNIATDKKSAEHAGFEYIQDNNESVIEKIDDIFK